MTDLAVFRRGAWYIKEIISGNTFVYNYGMAGDIPVTSLNVKRSIVPIP